MLQLLANCRVPMLIFDIWQRMKLVTTTEINTEHILEIQDYDSPLYLRPCHDLFFNLKLALRFCGSSCDFLGSCELSRDLKTIPCKSFPNLSDFVLSFLSEIVPDVMRGASWPLDTVVDPLDWDCARSEVTEPLLDLPETDSERDLVPVVLEKAGDMAR